VLPQAARDRAATTTSAEPPTRCQPQGCTRRRVQVPS
jgi:hypothetical protein